MVVLPVAALLTARRAAGRAGLRVRGLAAAGFADAEVDAELLGELARDGTRLRVDLDAGGAVTAVRDDPNGRRPQPSDRRRVAAGAAASPPTGPAAASAAEQPARPTSSWTSRPTARRRGASFRPCRTPL